MSDDLRPARYEPERAEPSFRRGVPWLWLGGLALFVVGVFGFVRYQATSEANEIRASIHATYARSIAPEARTILGFRSRVEALVVEAAKTQVTNTVIAPGFTLDKLRGRPGTYLRIRAVEAVDRASVSAAARTVAPDAIPQCLGIAPTGLRVLYDRAGFLDPEWVRGIVRTKDVMRLRVIEDQVRRHASRDVPLLRSVAESEYFLLLVVRGASRFEGPVDVRVFDAQTGRQLFATPASSVGTLFTARIDGTPRSRPPQEALGRSGAGDCAIASQIRAAFGGGTPEVAHEQVIPPRDAGVDGAATAPGAPGAPATPASPSPAAR